MCKAPTSVEHLTQNQVVYVASDCYMGTSSVTPLVTVGTVGLGVTTLSTGRLRLHPRPGFRGCGTITATTGFGEKSTTNAAKARFGNIPPKRDCKSVKMRVRNPIESMIFWPEILRVVPSPDFIVKGEISLLFRILNLCELSALKPPLGHREN
jgi:hypothetical protein